MNSNKQQTSSTSKKQQTPNSSSAAQRASTTTYQNTPPSTPNSRKLNQRRSQQQQGSIGGGNTNKKRTSPNQMDFLSFQPALQDCFQTPQQQQPQKQRSSPKNNGGGNNNNVAAAGAASQSTKYSSKVNGYNNSLSPIKLSSPAIAPIVRQGPQQSNSGRRQQQQRGSPLSLFKHTPFAGAKYLELPSTKDLPLPPAWLLEGLAPPTTAATSSSASSSISGRESSSSTSSSPISMCEPPSPTTEAAMKVAKENGFDGRIRISPLQLIAAVSSS
jgi:hypothetical protein